MIYDKNNNNQALFLTESDADEFLEENGIALYDEHVIIGESLLPGAEAEEILAENGIYLYEDGIVLEGEAAEKHRARRSKEYHDKVIQVINDRRKDEQRARKIKASSDHDRDLYSKATDKAFKYMKDSYRDYDSKLDALENDPDNDKLKRDVKKASMRNLSSSPYGRANSIYNHYRKAKKKNESAAIFESVELI